MALGQFSYTFRTFTAGGVSSTTAITDQAQPLPQIVAGASNWTQGSTIVDDLPISIPLVEEWTVVSVAIRGYLGLAVQGSSAGRLGRILAGIITDRSTPETFNKSFQAPWTQPVLPLPFDPSLVETLWDPASDPPPPQLGSSITNNPINQLLPVSAVVSPPQPLPTLTTGKPLFAGIWILPSLLLADANSHQPILYIQAATATVTYDDSTTRIAPRVT